MYWLFFLAQEFVRLWTKSISQHPRSQVETILSVMVVTGESSLRGFFFGVTKSISHHFETMVGTTGNVGIFLGESNQKPRRLNGGRPFAGIYVGESTHKP